MFNKNKSKSNKLISPHSKFILQKNPNNPKSKSFKKNKKQNIEIQQIITKKPQLKSIHKTGANSQKSSLQKKFTNLYNRQPFRKTAPNIHTGASSVQNQKITSLNSQSRQKSLKLLRKGIKNNKYLKGREQIKLVDFNQKLLKRVERYTSVEQNLNKNKVRNQGNSAQTCYKKPTSKSKILHSKKNLLNQTKKSKKASESKVVKSSCITRNASRNNSKEKQHGNINAELKKKFKKKTQVNAGLQKKTKKINIYSSMKISPRNSFQIVQTKSNQFHILDQNQQFVNFASFRKIKGKTKDVKLNKIQSLRDISSKLEQLLNCQNDSFQDVSKQIVGNKTNQFSFFKQNAIKTQKQQNLIKKKQQRNFNQISIEKLVQRTDEQIEFSLVCEESLRQKLNRIEQNSLKRLKEEQLRAEKLQLLNQFEKCLQKDRSLSTNQEFFQFAHINQVNFQTLFEFINKTFLKQRVEVIDWISMLSSNMLLKAQTFHLAVAYYDLYLSHQKNHLSNNQASFIDLKLIGVSCLIIAIKMEERQYEHDIFDHLSKLEIGFTREQVVKKELEVLKKISLKLKIETLPFWLDYFSQKWDLFLTNADNNFQQKDKMFLRSIDGKSYENYRKTIQIMNLILLEGGIFTYDFVDLTLSTLYLIFQQIIHIEHKQKLFEQINNFKNNIKGASDQKSKSPHFSTQDTLDQLSFNESKENSSENLQSSHNSGDSSLKENKLKLRNSLNKKQNLERSLKILDDIYDSFIQKYSQKDLKKLENTIKYVQIFCEIKQSFEMDHRVYQQAQSYEEFIRYHNYSVSSKDFVLKMYENSQKINPQMNSNFRTVETNANFKSIFSQKIPFSINVEIGIQRQKPIHKGDQNLSYQLSNQEDLMFKNQETTNSSFR